MTPDRYARLREVFLMARGLSDASRCSLLDQACAADPELRRELESLLADEQQATMFLEHAPIVRDSADAAPPGTPIGGVPDGSAHTPPAAPSPATRSGVLAEAAHAGAPTEPLATASFESDGLPGYRIVKEISRGGQGIVYQALQEGTKRKVAIKVLLHGSYASAGVRRRFEREIELVAQLKHPNIISVFHSGTSADGRAFCVMDYVSGRPLDRYAHENKLSLRETLALFRTVAEAVQYAHQRGMIHRDLKPSNILVDSDGGPRVLDFGLAKLVAAPADSLLTLSDQLLGTLPYMAPEQAQGRHDAVDTRTDVYALGVVLYELLTGQYPYPVTGPMAEVLRHISETEPAPPSRVWTAESGVAPSSGRRGRASGAIRQAERGSSSLPHPTGRASSTWRRRLAACPIDGEVETIVLKALSKDRERRYESAGALARDIGHYLAGDPIEAKRDSPLYVLKKTLRRHRTPVAIGLTFVLLLVGATVLMSVQAERNRRLAQRAAVAEHRATRTSDFLQSMLALGDPEFARGADLSLFRLLLDDAARRAEAELPDAPEIEAAVRTSIGNTYASLGLYQEAEPHLRAALRVREAVLGPEHLEVAESLHHLGRMLRRSGALQEAESMFVKSLALRRRRLGGEHPLVAESLHGLATVQHAKGDLAQAEADYRTALALRRGLLGARHRDVADNLNDLGALLYEKGEFGEAETVLREALELARESLGERHPLVGQALLAIGAVMEAKGDLAEAERNYRATNALWVSLLGEKHPYVAGSLNNLANLRYLQGDVAGAESLTRQVLDLRREAYGERHPEVAQSLHNLALLLHAQGKATEAEQLLRDALAIRRPTLAATSPDLAQNLNDLASILYGIGKLDEAESLFREALASYRLQLGEKHPRIAATLGNLAAVSDKQGEGTEAEQFYREALALKRDLYGDADLGVVSTRANLAQLLLRQGRPEDANPLFEDAERPLLEALKEESISEEDRAVALRRLIDLYGLWDRPEKAAEWRTKLESLPNEAASRAGRPRE